MRISELKKSLELTDRELVLWDQFWVARFTDLRLYHGVPLRHASNAANLFAKESIEEYRRNIKVDEDVPTS